MQSNITSTDISFSEKNLSFYWTGNFIIILLSCQMRPREVNEVSAELPKCILFCTHRKLPPVFMRAKIHTYPICILTVPKRTISVNVFLEKILTKWVDSWWTILIFCLNCFWTPAIKDPALRRTPKTPWYLSYHAWQVLAQLHPG